MNYSPKVAMRKLIPWSQVLLEKPTVAQPLKEFPELYGT
jgi:hypothetical protein